MRGTFVNFTNKSEMPDRCHGNRIDLQFGQPFCILRYQGSANKNRHFYFLVPFWAPLVERSTAHKQKMCMLRKHNFCPTAKLRCTSCTLPTYHWNVWHVVLCQSFDQHTDTWHFQLRFPLLHFWESQDCRFPLSVTTYHLYPYDKGLDSVRTSDDVLHQCSLCTLHKVCIGITL